MKILKLNFKIFKGVIIKKTKYLIVTLLFLSTFLSVSGQNNNGSTAKVKITFNASDKLDCNKITDNHRSKFCKKINSKGKTETTTSIVEIPFDTPLKLMAFSASFKSFGSHSHDIEMHYSVLNETLGWTEWLSLSEDTHDYDEEIYSTNLAFIRRGDTKIRFKIAGIDIDKSDLEVFFINVPERDESDKFLMKNDNEKSAACPKPQVLGRLSYLSSSQNTNHGTPVYTTVTHTVVHHAAWSTSSTRPTWRDVAFAVWELHRISKGWSDIAYNYLIDPDGNIYEGRAGGENVRGVGLCPGKHDYLMAVCMLGDFHQTNQFLTTNSRNSLVDILAWKLDKENINPLGSNDLGNHGVNNHIMGHRDECSTDCPGDNVYNALGDIRTRVANKIDSGCGDTGGGGTCSAPTYAQQYYSNLTGTSVRIYCSASGSLRDIQMRAGTSGAWTDYSAFSGSYKYVSGLQSGTYYQFRTRRRCTNGVWSSWSGAEYFNTTGGTCTAPTYAQQYYSNLTGTSVRIYCSASGSLRDIQIRVGTSGAWTDYSAFSGSYKYVSGLQPDTYYQFRTRRRCTNGVWSSWSGAEYFNTTGGTCTAPTYAQQYYSNLTDTSVRIYCTVSGTRDLQLRAGSSGAWTDYSSFSGSYKYISGLQPGTYYQFRTRHRCTNGVWSSWSGAEYFNTPSSKYEQDELATKVFLAPNPVKTGAEARVTIQSGLEETVRMIVTDISGRILYEQELMLDSGSNEISLRAFDTAGVYIIAIQSASANATLKLIVAE